jgi:hypothetical protein
MRPSVPLVDPSNDLIPSDPTYEAILTPFPIAITPVPGDGELIDAEA